MAQASAPLERFQLLNGLRVRITLRDRAIRMSCSNSGFTAASAFDLAGKGGSMALLGDLLFPDPTTREYFTEEMQGRLNVVTDYDSITITMQGRAREFEKIAEILRTALVTTQLTPENVTKARDGRIKIIKDTSISSTTWPTERLPPGCSAISLMDVRPLERPNRSSVSSEAI